MRGLTLFLSKPKKTNISKTPQLINRNLCVDFQKGPVTISKQTAQCSESLSLVSTVRLPDNPWRHCTEVLSRWLLQSVNRRLTPTAPYWDTFCELNGYKSLTTYSHLAGLQLWGQILKCPCREESYLGISLLSWCPSAQSPEEVNEDHKQYYQLFTGK